MIRPRCCDGRTNPPQNPPVDRGQFSPVVDNLRAWLDQQHRRADPRTVMVDPILRGRKTRLYWEPSGAEPATIAASQHHLASSGVGGADATDQAPSLYDRLGGVYNIATVIDDLIDRVMTDPRLNKNPAVDEAHHRVSPGGFKLAKFQVPPAEETEVVAIIESTRDAIVVPPLRPRPPSP